ncbi:hypothetical protein PU560_14650 [Georgenia sp. 10Sc9-8]|uniref:Uncharacterized protein n=1 Tax=Georgenia halotolerans TaxID=3028317 RepID=A0ABT5U046_9MICO|nr:hypothetical protein [Georgenia halotolerans]
MRTTVLTAAGAGLLLTLTACSTATDGDDAETPAGPDTGTADSSPETQACADFFEGDVPLADRAETDRAALSGGEITDDVAYAEINGLESRISSVADSAPEEISALLEQVNAPFTEAVDRVNAFEPAEDGPTVPELEDIDVSGSEEAQNELVDVCE